MSHDPLILGDRNLVAYVRCSDEQSDAERQRAAIRIWADNHDLKVTRWYEDIEGRNSRDDSEKRIQFQAMLDVLKTGVIGGIVVDSIERLGFKDNHEFGFFIHTFRQYGCLAWSTVEGNLSAVDPGTIFSNTAKTVGSKIETTNIARRNLSKKVIDAKQGLFQGGYPPFGFDIVCFERDQEVWRVVYDGGHYRRIKLYPDGAQSRYDGKGNFPSKDEIQVLRIRPSEMFATRLQVVKDIFRWFADENISTSQIATRLNTFKIPPQVGRAWNKQVIKTLLMNPAYTGFPSFNKRASSKFYEYKDGQAQPAVVEPGRMLPKQGRKRNRQDWITTEEVQFQPIIDSALFEKVQKKFVDRSESPQKNRTPRVESFWLRGFLVCFKCGKPMRAWNEKSWRSYFCSEYGTYGRLNPTGCRCHRVKADLIEGIVKSYLEETGQKAGVLQASQNKSVIISKAVEEYKTANELSNAAYDSLKLAAASFLQEGDQSVEIYGNCLPVRREGSQIFLPEGWSVEDIYDAFSAKQEVKLKSLIAKKEAEFDDLFQQFAKLKVQTAIDRANKLMAEKEQEILGLKSKLKPLSEVNRKAWQEVSSKIKALSEAKLAMQGANYRRLSESLKSLVDKIVCHFRYSESKKANQPKSYLEKVEIFPVVGQALVRYPEGNKPGQG